MLSSPFKNRKISKILRRYFLNDRDLLSDLNRWAWKSLKLFHQSGFQVFCGNRLGPEDEMGTETLARYIIRASFSQERMQYLAEPSKVVCRAKDGTEEKVFDALKWLAAICSQLSY